MRFAQLEMKAITALFLMQYEYSLENAAGQPIRTVPEVDRKDLYGLNFFGSISPKFFDFFRYKTRPKNTVCKIIQLERIYVKSDFLDNRHQVQAHQQIKLIFEVQVTVTIYL